MLYFASRTGWPHTCKKIDEMTTGALPLSWNGSITQNSFGNERGNFEKHETGPHQMPEARTEEKGEKNISSRY